MAEESPQVPYRDGRPLNALIPPDRRRRNAAILVGASVLSGILLLELAESVKALSREIDPPTKLGDRSLPPAPPPPPPLVVPPPEPAGDRGQGITDDVDGSNLRSADVERVVRMHQASVKRTCFERLTNGKPATISIKLSLTISASGTVTTAKATGDDPAMAACIQGAALGWQFPKAAGSTNVHIPFKFISE